MTRSRDAAPAARETPAVEAVRLTKVYSLRRGLFARGRGELRAVDGISFEVRHGETLGLVGESGSGKSTTGRLLVRLEEPTSGEIRLDGEDWLAVAGDALRRRRRDVQMVFQDPQSSLNPRMRVGDQIAEPLRVQRIARGRHAAARTAELLEAVGLSRTTARRFPPELSGGQRQRVAIARALATEPRFLVCDEPVSALDVSVGAQIVNLLLDLRDRMNLSALFISHDLAVVARVSERIAVLYRGRIVEEGPSRALVRRPLHPYTAVLLSAVLSAPAAPRIVLADASDPAAERPTACPFQTRCPVARPRCAEEAPALEPDDGAHRVACFYPGELAPTVAPATAARPI